MDATNHVDKAAFVQGKFRTRTAHTVIFPYTLTFSYRV